MTATVAAMANEEFEFPHIYKRVLMGEPRYPKPMKSSLIVDNKDKIFDMLTTMETDFNLEVEKVEDNPLAGFQHLLISPGTWHWLDLGCFPGEIIANRTLYLDDIFT